jgi:hypothetical protein
VADAIVEAAYAAKSRLAPARVGYGTPKIDLNVNRDLFNSKLAWRQEPNPDGPSDKTLAVVEFLGNDNVPIAVYMNYAMHPINFYLSGIISADFPGEASRYVEDLFDNRAVAIFTQGASGDQNPRDFRSPTTFMGERAALMTRGHGPFIQTVGPPPAPQDQVAPKGFNPQQASSERKAIPPKMWKLTRRRSPVPAIKVGVLRVGDINFVAVNGEVYSQIGMKLKANAPASKTIVVTLPNGMANSGYIYSDEAYSHLTF